MPKQSTSRPTDPTRKVSAMDAFHATVQNPLRVNIRNIGDSDQHSLPSREFGPLRNHIEIAPQNVAAIRASQTRMTKLPDGTFSNHDQGIAGTPLYNAIVARPGVPWLRIWNPKTNTTELRFGDGKSLTFGSAKDGGKLLTANQMKANQAVANQKAYIAATKPDARTNAFAELDAAPEEFRQSMHYLGGLAGDAARAVAGQSTANRQINQSMNPLLPTAVRQKAASQAQKNIQSSSKNTKFAAKKSMAVLHDMVGGPGGMGDTLATAATQGAHGDFTGMRQTLKPVPGNIVKYSKEQPLHQIFNGVALAGGVVGVTGKTGALAGRLGEAASGAADVADAAGNTAKASVLRTTASIAGKTSKVLAPPRQPQVVVHLTNQKDGPRITADEKIGTRIGVYGLAGNRVPKPGKLRNVLSQVGGDLSYGVPITGDAANVFRSPIPWGPNSLYRNLAGIKRAPLGSIDLKTRQFIPNEVFDKATKTFRPATLKDHLLYNGHVFTAEYLNDLLFYGGVAGYNGVVNHFEDQSRQAEERGEGAGVMLRKHSRPVIPTPAARRSTIKRY